MDGWRIVQERTEQDGENSTAERKGSGDADMDRAEGRQYRQGGEGGSSQDTLKGASRPPACGDNG